MSLIQPIIGPCINPVITGLSGGGGGSTPSATILSVRTNNSNQIVWGSAGTESWTVNLIAAGRYVITHNLGHTNYIPIGQNIGSSSIYQNVFRTANDCEVRCFRVTNQTLVNADDGVFLFLSEYTP